MRFGPAGNAERFYAEGFKASVQAPEWLAAQGLTAYEYSFGRGVSLSDDTAADICSRPTLTPTMETARRPSGPPAAWRAAFPQPGLPGKGKPSLVQIRAGTTPATMRPSP